MVVLMHFKYFVELGGSFLYVSLALHFPLLGWGGLSNLIYEFALLLQQFVLLLLISRS